MFFKSNNPLAPYSGFVFLPLSPFGNAYTNSSGKQDTMYYNLRKESVSPMDAVIHLASNHPYGENL